MGKRKSPNPYPWLWERIDKELKAKGLKWSQLGREISQDPDGKPVSSQTMTNWKYSGIPARYFRDIAYALGGYSVEQLLGEQWPPPPDEGSLAFSKTALEGAALIDAMPTEAERRMAVAWLQQVLLRNPYAVARPSPPTPGSAPPPPDAPKLLRRPEKKTRSD